MPFNHPTAPDCHEVEVNALALGIVRDTVTTWGGYSRSLARKLAIR